MKRFYFILFLLIFFALPRYADAVSISATSSRLEARAGEAVDVTIVVDTEGKNINALSGQLNFDPKILQPYAISTDGSVVTLWPDKPFQNDGNIKWGGIIPGGFSGVRSSFYDGLRPGKVLGVSFLVLTTGETDLFLADSKYWLNDGKGIPVPLPVSDITVKILPGEALSKFIPNLPKDSNISQYQSVGDIEGDYVGIATTETAKSNSIGFLILIIGIFVVGGLIYLYRKK